MLEKDLLRLAETAGSLEPKTLKLALLGLAQQASITDSKAQKWDALGEEIHEMYSEDEEDDDGMGLIVIGEAAAIAYGYLV